ncbi:acetyl-CoA/propionyl-CoA carboxylase biotin carboxyl carrier protein [Aurantimicrobium minutum]|uniref:acetyl/propionyl/methylcrotonyl-CoA carboxylase subunit alpha n=1 Tax=Aurantimicrobium minutum TaxID=708131 RepID=UPI002473DF60|nr:acetyl-CoA carboxylase biotin carboxylase subunit [Aurantimicrobium minutum]MDH6277816.1 acetyl-CoA/propionyl-CoA carboxylase biotin carboxyl carrier protein [Aurantimicrobium minutum]
MFKKVLIANRGEIAVRIMRSAKELGITSVAVYSDADAQALHVRSADETVALGDGPAKDNYLNIEKIIQAAKKSGAEAIHPGYGFLSENAEFAAAVTAAGMKFIGPSEHAIRTMGEKVAARAVAVEANVPLAPGTNHAVSGEAELLEFGEKNGYPILIKASNGGGGRGMRQAKSADEVAEAFASAVREATAAFGSGDVFVERYLTNARHVEVQVFADSHGNAVFYGDRDCSVQRRHQKLLEEAPAPFLSEELREQMGEAAVRLAREVAYEGAGTVEFLVEDNKFYFLEMNTRIQVEHPVTEMVTGVDLVSEQIRVAAGLPLNLPTSLTSVNGAAVEARINAEDVAGGNFFPSPGLIESISVPEGSSIRWDSGYLSGDEVSPNYDSLVGKLIVHGANRAEAIKGLYDALAALKIEGISTTIPAAMAVLDHSDFQSGAFSTLWLERSVTLPESGEEYEGALTRQEVEVGGRFFVIPFIDENFVGVASAGAQTAASDSAGSGRGKSRRSGGKAAGAQSDGKVKAPMQGTIVKMNVAVGDAVTEGTVLFVLEAMKMENPIKAPFDGTVKEINVELGSAIAAKTVLAEIEA